jgi:membrane peptidoglycan carboxypeptidase
MTYGFQSAAQYRFGREVQHLTQAEQLALITIAKNANTYHPLKHPETFRNRFLALSDVLYQQGLLTKEEYLHIDKENFTFLAQTNTQFNYVVDFLKKYYLNTDLTLKTTTLLPTSSGWSLSGEMANVYTTIDQHLTETIENLAAYTISDLQIKNVSDYAVLLLDKETNALKVMIGGNPNGKEGQVNATTAINQVGSTLKPFLYLLAFQNL